MNPCSDWKYDTLHAIVKCGSAFFEDISKGMQILVNYPILLTYMVVMLSSKGTLVCNSSSSVLVLNRTSPSLLHTFVAYTTQLSIALNIPVNALGCLLVFLTFPYPVPKNCVDFYWPQRRSTCKSGWIAQAEKRYCVSKKGGISRIP